jgi:hypothetical protein
LFGHWAGAGILVVLFWGPDLSAQSKPLRIVFQAPATFTAGQDQQSESAQAHAPNPTDTASGSFRNRTIF